MEKVDSDILQWIARETGDPALSSQIESATVRKRDYTRTGFFVHFEADADAAPAGKAPVCPRLDAPGLPDGAGSDLFMRDGRLHYLEVYARGGFLPEPFEGYELRPDD